MIINNEMQKVLDELSLIEVKAMPNLLCLPTNEMGNQLIELYYRRKNAETQDLVRRFMTMAGTVWLRKLLIHDTNPIASSKGVFASLDEYLGLLSANDDAEFLLANA